MAHASSVDMLSAMLFIAMERHVENRYAACDGISYR